jgi:DNA-binding NarL/FixJ family response regulator
MTGQNQPGSVGKRRVLIVDDHVLFREGLTSLLKYTPDFEVVGSAGSVTEAIAVAFELQPEIILMDFTLSDGTGLDATRAILAKYPACKIVFLTVYEANSTLFAAIRQGAKGYILKNVPTEDLLASLRALERGETAMSRALMNRVLEEFSHSGSEKAEKEEVLKKLSQRELEILKELETGATNKVIGQRLYLSENTIKHHIRSILEKLSVETRFQAIEVARKGRFN